MQCRNGQLMRPDSKLYIVPFEGGEARRLSAQYPADELLAQLFPNGRWLVFSSKSRSPYTQMFLTHLDEEGNDSPAILIENATAANRAVNIPEFVNIPPDGMQKIDVPATDFYRLYNPATSGAEERARRGGGVWKKAIELDPEDPKAHYNLAVSLQQLGRLDEGGHALPQEPRNPA